MILFKNLLEWFRQRHTPSITPEQIQDLVDETRRRFEADVDRSINAILKEWKHEPVSDCAKSPEHHR